MSKKLATIELKYLWLDGEMNKSSKMPGVKRSMVFDPKLRVKSKYFDVENNDSTLKRLEKLRDKRGLLNLAKEKNQGAKTYKKFLDDIFEDWSHDGSSTQQAVGENSDCILRPVVVAYDPTSRHDFVEVHENHDWLTFIVYCEVHNNDKKLTVHTSNTRSKLRKALDNNNMEMWIGLEQEYYLHKPMITPISNSKIVDNVFLVNPLGRGQGSYYCGLGMENIHAIMPIIEKEHIRLCRSIGIDANGTNAEVGSGQQEYQLFAKDPLLAADQLIISRYFLERVTSYVSRKANMKVEVNLHPKPFKDPTPSEAKKFPKWRGWNGSGMHLNFSTKMLRTLRDMNYVVGLAKIFAKKENVIACIKAYGVDNHLRLSGDWETSKIDEFSFDPKKPFNRGASFRIPDNVGRIEDRRPSSNADPYQMMLPPVKMVRDYEKKSINLQKMYKEKLAEA